MPPETEVIGRYEQMLNDEVLTLREAAAFLRVSQKTAREKAKRGEIPGQQVGRGWRFSKRALEAWLGGAGAETSGVVADPPQIYLRSRTEDTKDSRAGFRDTAFTKNRDEPVHRWVPWIAGFSAGFVGEILDRELGVTEDNLTVLDPFAGVGTTLVEGLARNCDVAGFEINPYAALASSVKLDALSRDADEVRKAARSLGKELKKQLSRGAAAARSKPPAGFHTRDQFLSPAVERQVLFAKDVIDEQPEEWLRRLARLALGAVLVGISNYTYEPSLGRRAAVGKPLVHDADVPGILRDKLLGMAADIEHVQLRRGAVAGKPTARVFNASYLTDAVDRLGADSVDVAITSPPYLNNYHYVRNTRPQMFWLDFVAESGELRELETTSFGKFWQTVRAGEPVELAFEYPELEERLALLRSLHPEKGAYGGAGWANYAATYFNDCARFCKATAQVMRPGGLVVVVIGNNILQSIEFKTDEYFARIAERYGFEVRGMHLVRKKRTGSSIVNSSVRVGVTNRRVELYETAVELQMATKRYADSARATCAAISSTVSCA
jgi:excisionase family DNA binding protein